MRGYCLRGYEIVRKEASLEDAAEIVRSHRERFDGTGYPRGLEGEAIPIGARIVAVADALELIVSDRPHRGAPTFATAGAEIQRWSGRQFDPRIVDALSSAREVGRPVNVPHMPNRVDSWNPYGAGPMSIRKALSQACLPRCSRNTRSRSRSSTASGWAWIFRPLLFSIFRIRLTSRRLDYSKEPGRKDWHPRRCRTSGEEEVVGWTVCGRATAKLQGPESYDGKRLSIR